MTTQNSDELEVTIYPEGDIYGFIADEDGNPIGKRTIIGRGSVTITTKRKDREHLVFAGQTGSVDIGISSSKVEITGAWADN